MNNFDFVCFRNNHYVTGILEVNEKYKTNQRERIGNLLNNNKNATYSWDMASRYIPIFGNKQNEIDRFLLLDLIQIVEECITLKLYDKATNIVIAHYFHHQHKNIPDEINISVSDLKKQSAIIYSKFNSDDFEFILNYIFRKKHQLFFPPDDSRYNQR